MIEKQLLWYDLKQRQEKFKGTQSEHRKYNPKIFVSKKFPQKDSEAKMCKFAVFPFPFIPRMFCWGYVDSQFEYRHRYSLCLSKDLRSAEPPSTPPPRVVSVLYIYLGTIRGVQNSSRMPFNPTADNFKTVLSFFGFFIYQVFSFGLRMLEVVHYR